MQKVLALILALTLAACGVSDAQTITGGVIVHTHSGNSTGGSALIPATIAMTGTLSSTKACAASFTRMHPNLCMRTDTVSEAALTSGACTQITLPDAAAKILIMQVAAVVTSNNVANQLRSVQLGFHPTGACAGAVAYFHNTGNEQVALGVNATLTTTRGQIHAPVVGGALWYFVQVLNAGSISEGQMQVRGYYD